MSTSTSTSASTAGGVGAQAGRPPGTGPGPAVTSWAVALLLLAALPLSAAFDSPLVLGPLAGAVVVPFAVVALARRLRLPAWAAASATLSLVLVVGASFARSASPALTGTGAGTGMTTVAAWRTTPFGEAAGPVVDAVARLLTAPRPAPVEHVVPVAMLTAVVALAVALAVARGSRARLAPLVGAVVLYGAAQLLTAGAADAGPVAAACVVVAAAGWLLLDGEAVRRGTPEAVLGRAAPGSRVRWRAGGVAGLVVVALVGAAGAGAATAVRGAPYEPREHVTPPRVPMSAAHPVAELARWHAEPDVPLLRVRGQHPGYLSWVTLPDFDGARWAAHLDLRPVGAVVEPALPPGAARGEARAEVELLGLAGASGPPGVWLPSVGHPVSTTAPGALSDADTGVLALAGPDARLPEGLVYELRAHVDVSDVGHAAAAGVPAGEEVARYLELPRLPADLRAYAQAVVEGAPSRLEQAMLLAEEVRTGRELAHDAVSGSSYARVRELLFAEAADGGQVGTSEQFTTAFAVLGRAVGLPTRVVLGFEVPPAEGEEPVVVHGADARMWAEVYFAGPGWVRFDPTPGAATATGLAPDLAAQQVGDVPQDGEDGPAQDLDPAEGGADEDPEASGAPLDESAPGAAGRWAGALAALLGVALLAVPAGLAVARAGRRRRLRTAGVVGAWQHVADAMLLRQGLPAPSRTAPRIADDVARLVDSATGAAAATLARAAEAAAFAPGPASPEGSTWSQAAQVSRALRRSAPWRRRITWWVDPRPLRRR
ncbi:hypothetical protein DNL40_15850 [Xylanimonas oleitrophica]|uniref:Transglutaminase-like domain-containing protein n=1 Tax=Xylanimonas oleitrophica TaxID=2607479 RepID=A0A2W5WUQ8_9MICO|nr:transglutaminase-like domain-containing protein [Xylanimonas oleitrophica]PZR51565.1 hypothetical protein DNL40_15850 [Xylanimonas oleitrophica]